MSGAKSDFRRLDEIKRWRAGFSVDPELATVDRTVLVDRGRVPVFQHTLEDYDYMLSAITEARLALRRLTGAERRYTDSHNEGSPYDEVECLHDLIEAHEASEALIRTWEL